MKSAALSAIALTILLAVAMGLPTVADEQQPPAEQSALAAAEIEHLQEWVDTVETTHTKIQVLQKAGARGGDDESVAMAYFQMCVAKARLATAQNDLESAQKWYGRSATASDQAVQILESNYQAGLVTLDVLLLMQQRRAETKIALSQIQDKIQ